MKGITTSQAIAETAISGDCRQADELAILKGVMKGDASSPEMR
jgi:hypothetical protein